MNNKLRTILQGLPDVLVILFWVYLIETQGGKGFLIGLAPLALIAFWRCWKARHTLVAFWRYVETMMYGKPLDKEYWKPGEKRKMRKIVWR